MAFQVESLELITSIYKSINTGNKKNQLYLILTFR